MTTGTLRLTLLTVAAGVVLAGTGVLSGAAPSPSRSPGAPLPPTTGAVDPHTGEPPAPPPAAGPKPAPPAPRPPVTDIQFSPDGARYVVSPGVTVHDRTGKVLYTVPGVAGRFSPDGNSLLVMGEKVRVCDAATGRVREEHPGPKIDLGWHVVGFSPDGKRYAAHLGFSVRVFDTATGFEPVRLKQQFEPGSTTLAGNVGKQLVWSADGKQLAAVGVLVGEGKLGAAVWDVSTGDRTRVVEAPINGTGPRAAAFSPDGKTFATIDQHRIYRWEDGAREPRETATLGDLGAVAFMPDGRAIVGGEGKYADGGKPPEETVYHRRLFLYIEDRRQAYGGTSAIDFTAPPRPENAPPVTALAASPDGKTAVVGTGVPPLTEVPKGGPPRGELKVFSLEPAAPPAEAERNQDLWSWREQEPLALITPVHAVVFAPDGKRLASADGDDVTVWDLGIRDKIANFSGYFPPAVALSPDGRYIAITTKDKVELLHPATTELFLTLEEKDARPTAAAFGPVSQVAGKKRYQLAFTDGRTVWAKTWVDGAAPGTARFGPLKDAPKVDAKVPAGAAYSPDGKRIVFIPNSKTDPKAIDGPDKTHYFAMVWGAGSGEAMGVLPHGTRPVTAVAWAPDGRIATADDAGVVVIWDGTTLKERKRITLSGPVTGLAFRADGKRFAAGIDAPHKPLPDPGDRLVVVTEWEGASPDNWGVSSRLGVPPGERVRAVAFSPDGFTLAAGVAAADGKRGLVRTWERVKLAPKAGPKP